MYWLHEIELNIVSNLAIVHLCNYPSKSEALNVGEVGLPNVLLHAVIIRIKGELFVHLLFDTQRKSVQDRTPVKELCVSLKRDFAKNKRRKNSQFTI